MSDEMPKLSDIRDEMKDLLEALRTANAMHDLASLRAAAIEVISEMVDDEMQDVELLVDCFIEVIRLGKKLQALA